MSKLKPGETINEDDRVKVFDRAHDCQREGFVTELLSTQFVYLDEHGAKRFAFYTDEVTVF